MQKELLAVVYALMVWRYILYCKHIIIETDHRQNVTIQLLKSRKANQLLDGLLILVILILTSFIEMVVYIKMQSCFRPPIP